MEESKNKSIPKDLQDVWDLAGNYTYSTEHATEESWELFELKAKNKVRRMTWIKYAAAVILVVSGVFTYNTLSTNDKSGVETFATNYGEFEVISLKDGTTVKIAPNSTLEVLGDYGNKTRTIHLKGQAKFTVVRNEECPFIVQSENLITTVLGTIFEVRNDTRRNQQVVVYSGKVKVTSAQEEVLLITNQSASFANQTLTKEPVFDFNNWNGVNKSLKYKNATLSQIKDDIQAITGKTLVIPEDRLGEKFTGKFENSGDVASICKVLSMAFDFKVTAK